MTKSRFWQALTGISTLGLLSACSPSLDAQNGDAVPPPLAAQDTRIDTSAQVKGGPRIMPFRDVRDSRSAAPKNTAGTQLLYWGGHVISNVKVYAVFWTGAVRQETKDKIGGFFTAVTANPYIDWLTEYNTTINSVSGAPGTNQTIGRGTFAGAVTITPSIAGTSLTNDNISAELNHQIDIHALADPDENTLYMFFFPAGYSIDLGGQKSCQVFCAYHNTVVRAGKSIYYGVMPDVGADGCQLGCGLDADVFNNLSVATSHEMVEAITDAEVGLATSNGPPLAWYDTSKGEIGDICAAQADTLPGTPYKIQKEWSNKCNACITTPDAGCTGADSTPIVSLISPGSGDSVTGTINVSAYVTDRADAIKKVTFYINLFFPIGTATKAPWTVQYNTSRLKSGSSYILSATATDAGGKSGNSGWISVTKK